MSIPLNNKINCPKLTNPLSTGNNRCVRYSWSYIVVTNYVIYTIITKSIIQGQRRWNTFCSTTFNLLNGNRTNGYWLQHHKKWTTYRLVVCDCNEVLQQMRGLNTKKSLAYIIYVPISATDACLIQEIRTMVHVSCDKTGCINLELQR